MNTEQGMLNFEVGFRSLFKIPCSLFDIIPLSILSLSLTTKRITVDKEANHPPLPAHCTVFNKRYLFHQCLVGYGR